MSDTKLTTWAGVVLKLCIAAALVVGAATKQQYSYYSFLRWLLMISSVYFAYKYYDKKSPGLMIYFLGIAVVFNSFHKITFQKETWHLIDYAVAVLTTLTAVYDLFVLAKSTETRQIESIGASRSDLIRDKANNFKEE